MLELFLSCNSKIIIKKKMFLYFLLPKICLSFIPFYVFIFCFVVVLTVIQYMAPSGTHCNFICSHTDCSCPPKFPSQDGMKGTPLLIIHKSVQKASDIIDSVFLHSPIHICMHLVIYELLCSLWLCYFALTFLLNVHPWTNFQMLSCLESNVVI